MAGELRDLVRVRLRRAMAINGWSTHGLARAAGVSRTHLQRFLNPDSPTYRNPSIDWIDHVYDVASTMRGEQA